MKVFLINHTHMPEKIIAAAAKTCYSNTNFKDITENLSDKKTEDFVKMLAEIGHESPMEHTSFTFAIDGVSRSLLAQITRHRIASFSVRSQRYVRENEFSFIIPPEIEENKELLDTYKQCMENIFSNYNILADGLFKKHYDNFIKNGLDEKTSKSKAEKVAIEDARYVLPNSCATSMVMTMNARALMNFFSLRCCERAQWEIRILAEEMYKLVLEIAPILFSKSGPNCTNGPCTEGKMNCGKINQVREKYKGMRENG